ncbi:MAG: LysE family translocator [Pseudomonadota bacterium]
MTLILTAWIALATAAISPGPNLVAVASRGLGSGRRSALIVAAGLACGAFLWSFLTAVGFGALFQTFPSLLRVLGVLGGGYLLWLGIKGWRAALTGKGGQIAPVAGRGVTRDFLHGLAVTATNPKVALLWASLSTFVGPVLEDRWALLVFTLGSAVIVFAIYGTYGWLFSTGRMRRIYRRFQSASEAAFGTLFGGLGAFMVHRAL